MHRAIICLSNVLVLLNNSLFHNDVIKWKHFPRYWPFVRGIHRSPVNSTYKGQWRGALMFSLICVWIKGWVNTRKAGDLRRDRAHYDVSVMFAAQLLVMTLQTGVIIRLDVFVSHASVHWNILCSNTASILRRTMHDIFSYFVILGNNYLTVVLRNSMICEHFNAMYPV